MRSALSSLLNVDLSLLSWSQASLPVRWGGVGVRNAHQLAPFAFLASAAGAADLLTLILPPFILAIQDPEVPRAVTSWHLRGGLVVPSGLDAAT